MESTTSANQPVESAPAVAENTQPAENPVTQVAAAVPENAAVAVPADNAAEEPKKEEPAPTEDKTAPAAEEEPKATEEEYEEEEEEEEEPEPEEEEWMSEDEVIKPRRRGRKAADEESDEDEEYGRSKRRKVMPVKKVPNTKAILASEPASMKALRQYTSALKLGPRCFRGINAISNIKDREAELINRLHSNGRSWAGEYPSSEEIMLAKEETRQKKAEKARQFIIDEDDGVRSSRKAAQKARDFVKNLGEEEEDEEEEEVVNDEDVDADMVEEDNKDDE